MEVIQHSMSVSLRQNDISRSKMLSDLTVVNGRWLETVVGEQLLQIHIENIFELCIINLVRPLTLLLPLLLFPGL